MYSKIMVPLDGSKVAECVLPHVEAVMSGCRAATVIFVRVAEPLPLPLVGEEVAYSPRDWDRLNEDSRAVATAYLNNIVSGIRYEGATVKTQVLYGNPADSLADYATKNNVELVVIATHGRSGVRRWVWGSVADRLLRSLCLPVLMVRAPGCVPGV
ncbi:MAG: universal stress protein [Chloroflexota bacterium]